MPIQSIVRTPLPDRDPPSAQDMREYRDRWPLLRLRASRAWDNMPNDAGEVTIAVVDSGVSDNEQNARAWVAARTAIPGGTRDDEDHGMLVIETVRACTASGPGGQGAGKIHIVPLKFCSPQVLPSAQAAARAINEAMAMNPQPRVVLLAWDVGSTAPELEAAIRSAGDNGAVVVVAAGNHSLNNDEHPNWPANYGTNMDHVITVMASDEHDERASFSSYGTDSVYIAAPGFASLEATYAGSLGTHGSLRKARRRFSGTSAAAAYVAGLVALIRAQNPSWGPAEVKKHLWLRSRRVAALEKYCRTGGIADYQAALEAS